MKKIVAIGIIVVLLAALSLLVFPVSADVSYDHWNGYSTEGIHQVTLSEPEKNAGVIYKFDSTDVMIYVAGDGIRYTVKTGTGNRWVQYTFGNPNAVYPCLNTTEKSIKWRCLYHGMDIKYTLVEDGLKQEIIAQIKPQGNYFTEKITVSSGVTYQREGDEFWFYHSGERLFKITKPYAIDANGTQFDVGIKKVVEDSIAYIRLNATEVLQNGTYPIVIDPTTYSGATDTWTLTSEKDGDWTDVTVWGGSYHPHSIPNGTAVVNVGHDVKYNVYNTTFDIGKVTINSTGCLNFSTTMNTNLDLKDDLVIESGGYLKIGSPANPLSSTYNATIRFNCTATDGLYGLKNSGNMVLQGASKTVKTLLTADAAATATVLTIGDTTNWEVGDRLAIASTTRTWSEAEDHLIQSVDSATQVTLQIALSYAHSGISPTQAEVINLKRNVKITSKDTNYRGYVCCYSGSTSDVDYVEFYMLGYATTDKYGIDIKTTAADATNFAYCSVWGKAASNYGFSIIGQNITVSNNVVYNCYWYPFYIGTSGNTISNNIAMRSEKVDGFYTTKVQNIVSNNVATSNYYYGFYVYQSAVTISTFSNNVAHSNRKQGFYIKALGIISNCTAWRNNAYGAFYLTGCSEMSLNDCTAFGNVMYNILLENSVVTIDTPVLNGDSSFSTSYGIAITGSPNCVIKNGDLGSASGIKTTHSSADITTASYGFSEFDIINTKLSSATKVSNINNAIIGSYVQCEDLDQTQYNDKAWYKYGIVVRDNSTFKTGSYAMRFDQFWAADDWLEYEVQIPVKDGESVVISAWLRKNAAYTSANRPKIKLSGMGIIEIEDQMSDVTDTWEKVTVSGIPTRTGAAKLNIMTYMTDAGANAWCDFEKTGLTQPVLNTLEQGFWVDGHTATILFDTGSITAKEFWEYENASMGGGNETLENLIYNESLLLVEETEMIGQTMLFLILLIIAFVFLAAGYLSPNATLKIFGAAFSSVLFIILAYAIIGTQFGEKLQMAWLATLLGALGIIQAIYTLLLVISLLYMMFTTRRQAGVDSIPFDPGDRNW